MCESEMMDWVCQVNGQGKQKPLGKWQTGISAFEGAQLLSDLHLCTLQNIGQGSILRYYVMLFDKGQEIKECY